MDIEKYRIVLGSQSPRRSQLLKALDINFELRVIEIDESYPSDLPTHDIAAYIATQKANAHKSSIADDELVITADTIVAHNDVIYGKPTSKEDAVNTLLTLSDSTHSVYTGVCLLLKDSLKVFTVKSDVKFAAISEAEANAYFDNYNPTDKAGSYGIQDWMGMAKVEWIAGSYNNIVGLPTAELYSELSDLLR